jgi:Spy/CpxP family protein refolding chaperone
MGAFGRGGRGGRGGDNNAERTARNPVEQASNDLRKVLEDKASTEDQIKQKLTAFREARDKARTELTSAQKELKEVLMPRQEAVLVTYGLVD